MADPRTINYAGGQKIDNTEMVSKKINDAVQPVASDLAAEISRATNEEQNLQNRIGKLRIDLNKEIEDREAGDTVLDNKIGDLNDLETVSKSNTVAAINELKREIPTAVNDLKEYVDAADERLHEADEQLKEYVDAADERLHEADEQLKEYVDVADERLHEADEHLQEQIDELTDFVKPLDEVPTEGSERIAKSGGTWDAIRFASVKVGETMYWPVSEKETREVVSDNPFTFRFKGKDYSVEPVTPDTVDLIISKNIPDGWHALDGSVELEAAEYPDLAAFMPDNVTNDGKIWLPYARQKIIKVKY